MSVLSILKTWPLSEFIIGPRIAVLRDGDIFPSKCDTGRQLNKSRVNRFSSPFDNHSFLQKSVYGF